MSKNRKLFTIVSLVLVFVVMLSFSAVQYSRAEKYKTTTESSYVRAFYDLVQNVTDVETSLSKAVLASDSYQLVKIATELSHQSAFAISNLGQIPLESEPLEKTSRFLSQVGDFTYSLALKHADGSPIEESETESIKNLQKYAASLSEALNDIKEKLGSGELTFEQASGEKLSMLSESFNNIESKNFNNYPSLIYDGPFSEHVNTMQSIMLASERTVSQEEALVIAMGYLFNNIEMAYVGQTDGKIPAYIFSGDSDKCHYYVEISKSGGKCVNILCSRSFGEPTIATEEAIAIAKNYLAKVGYKNMKESYYETSGGCVTANFAYEQNGVVMYPDLVKVKVALDTGEIAGFEAKGYLMNHRDVRTLSGVIISSAEATKHISKNFVIENVGLAVIPTEYGDEKYCYEIKGAYNNKNFLVYVNTQTGREEDILLLVHSNNGVLTI
ncbi:MAG: germination protein YpeB [Bacillota bacterium]|nr:germination protein YpeB [Bacillota bacterium]